MLGSKKDLRVLIALANGQAAKGARAVFKEQGAEAYKVAEGKQSALELIQSNNFNLILVEDTFSDLGGIDFIRYVRMVNAPISVAPIIYAIKDPDRAKVIEARDAGANKMIVMPFTTASLLKNLKDIMVNPKPFIRVTGYSGPCRRQQAVPLKRPDRRNSQQGALPVDKLQKLFRG